VSFSALISLIATVLPQRRDCGLTTRLPLNLQLSHEATHANWPSAIAE
jgi:hypothetical protein